MVPYLLKVAETSSSCAFGSVVGLKTLCTVCVYMCSQALVPTYSPPSYPKSDSMAQVEKDLGLKEEHSDFVQRQIRKFCLKCIPPTPSHTPAPLTHKLPACLP